MRVSYLTLGVFEHVVLVSSIFRATLYALLYRTDLLTRAWCCGGPNSVFRFIFRKCVRFWVRVLIRRNHDQVKLDTWICVSHFKSFFPPEDYSFVCVCVCVCVRVLNISTVVTSLTFEFKLSNEAGNSTLLSFSSHDIFVFLC